MIAWLGYSDDTKWICYGLTKYAYDVKVYIITLITYSSDIGTAYIKTNGYFDISS